MLSKMLFSLTVLLTILVATVAAGLSSSSGSQIHSPDLSKAELTELYNSPVDIAERVNRPKGDAKFAVGVFSHSGVRVTLTNAVAGSREWLVHKGDNFGIDSQTVVVRGEDMSDRWKVKETKYFHGSKTVADFVKAGGSEYRFWTDNCHHGAKRMMNP